MRKKLEKLIVILGPTASGKTTLSIKLAKKFNGEVISADSRQVYKGMNIGTAKVTKREMQGVAHHLLDVANPKRHFTVAQYKKLAQKAIEKIQKKGKVPFLVGGTGFYIQAVVDEIIIPQVKPDWKLRKKLEKKSPKELYKILKKLDPERAKTIEKENPRRLIRAVEILFKTKKPIPPLKKGGLPYPVLMIGIEKTERELKNNIKKRLIERLKKGMIAEVKRLKKEGVSFKRLEEFGLEYRFIAQYLQEKIVYEQMVEKIQRESEKYVKRQMRWFKRDKRIKWIKKYGEVERLIKKYLKK